MTAELEPRDLISAEGHPETAVKVPRRTPRVVALLFGLFLLLLGEIALSGGPAPVDASYPHSLRAVIGEGCGGG